LLGKSDLLGSLKPGKYADIIAVSGNPLEDVRLLENVKFVMKEGKIYKQNRKRNFDYFRGETR